MSLPKPLPIGIQTFRSLIEGQYLYVDKTPLIYELIRNPKGAYFLSRPRRFGKSLLISTLEEIFLGNRALFQELWLFDSPYQWESYPVIRLDFSLEPVRTANELVESIKRTLADLASQHQITLQDAPYYAQWQELIRSLAAKQAVVVLVDEYDKPLIDNLQNLEEAKQIQEVLKSFYAVLKGLDRYVRFVFLTGISKFSKVGVFSGLNNLQDLSMDDRYAALPGITQAELESNFQPYLQRYAEQKSTNVGETLVQIRRWYNGFRFTKADITLYNPFSLLYFFEAQDFRNYWFESGTPTFLVQLLKEQGYEIEKLKRVQAEEIEFSTYELENLAITPIFFQTGYLTIKDYDPTRQLFTLSYPNYEVENSFLTYILAAYSAVENSPNTGLLWELIDALQANQLDGFFATLQIFFAKIPYNLQIKREQYYQTIFYLIFTLLGLRTQAEVVTNRGRIDAVIELSEAIYIFEFKLDGSEQAALAQIKTMEYYQRYRDQNKRIYLVGVNFSTRQRSVAAWSVEQVRS